MCLKVPPLQEEAISHSASELHPSSPCLPPLPPRDRDVPASSGMSAVSVPLGLPLRGMSSPPPPLPGAPYTPLAIPCGVPANILLHLGPTPISEATVDIPSSIRMLFSCIDMCVTMLVMYITTTEASKAHFSQRKQLKRQNGTDVCVSPLTTLRRHESEEDALKHPHIKQIFYVLAWHIGIESARWYVKPRSTCWFEEYIFNIYTPDMFYDILRMRRRIFDMLVQDLRPYIQGQHTHWRQPIDRRGKKSGGHIVQANAWGLYTFGCRQSRTWQVNHRQDIAACMLCHKQPFWAFDSMAGWTKASASHGRLPIQTIIPELHWRHRWIACLYCVSIQHHCCGRSPKPF